MPVFCVLLPAKPVAADELREAAFEDVAFANPIIAVYLNSQFLRFYDCCAAERSLAELVSCYGYSPVWGRYKCACPARYSDESAKLSLASTRPTRISAVRRKPLAWTLAVMSASVPCTQS